MIFTGMSLLHLSSFSKFQTDAVLMFPLLLWEEITAYVLVCANVTEEEKDT